MRDRDGERKEKGKEYADKRRNAQDSNIKKGDKVLLRQEKTNKLSTPFKSTPFTVVQKDGNSVVVESDGVQYRRNVTKIKKLLDRDSKINICPEDVPNLPEFGEQDLPVCTSPSTDLANHKSPEDSGTRRDNPVYSRPVRVKKLPSRFDDYMSSVTFMRH